MASFGGGVKAANKIMVTGTAPSYTVPSAAYAIVQIGYFSTNTGTAAITIDGNSVGTIPTHLDLQKQIYLGPGQVITATYDGVNQLSIFGVELSNT